MSKIGKQPIELPEGVTVELGRKKIKVSGPKGTLEKILPDKLQVVLDDKKIIIKKVSDGEMANMLYGTFRSLIFNMVKGVVEGWNKQLELVGTGYRAEISNGKLVMNIGFSHPVEINPPEGISFKVEKNIISVEGVDKEKVGQIAAKIRAVRPPEPYKGKGIKYVDEVIRRKAGKAAKAQA
ncbi:MAG: 50S ribosomal protein L6 [Patescibacteria group bacterium]|nr:MAG: 50S ribosomal protein L6 [Patescibacteria group bacterium]